jgi:DNA mismatch repair protein MutL
MSDIIKLLPDSVANQIAAGEVIQRPASVVKELVENAIDAEATTIKINIKDAGRTLIQITDDGKGMSDTDARMAFERHATSKISKAEDIFKIRSMGFRGEALASIASIAQVELRTKPADTDLGTQINIAASEVISQECVACPKGSNFTIKNIFYNIPARRKFLKSNNAEFRYILDDFFRIAIANPAISFQLSHNDKEIYNLQKSHLKQRIVNLFGRQFEKNLLTVASETSIINIYGFICLPEFAKKKSFEQFFFVNNRYMKHRSFYGAIARAYENLIPNGYYPSYFIFFEIDPELIDINIHPTKTEIKFSDEFHITQILEATIRESLGKHNIVPSLDFSDSTDYNDIFSKPKGSINTPSVSINPGYNPFGNNYNNSNRIDVFKPGSDTINQSKNTKINTEFSISEDEFENSTDEFETTTFESKINNINSTSTDLENSNTEKMEQNHFFQIKKRYIATMVKSGLMLIDQKKAHERILFEEFSHSLKSNSKASQLNLFPISFEAHAYESDLLKEMLPDFRLLGFDIEEFGKNTYVINGVPSDLKTENIESTLHELLHSYEDNKNNIQLDAKDNLALSLAKSTSVKYGQSLSQEEMRNLTDRLFACKTPNITFDGKKTIIIIDYEDINKRFG